MVEVVLSDVDRGVYETLTLRPALHPSESPAYLVARVLAYALEYEEGVAFSKGLEAADEPAVWVKDLTGQLLAWIEVGTPDGARLHKASKAARRVAVYCHKQPDGWWRALQSAHIHAGGAIKFVVLDRAFVEAVAARLDRRTSWSVTVTEGVMYLEVDGEALSCVLERRTLGAEA